MNIYNKSSVYLDFIKNSITSTSNSLSNKVSDFNMDKYKTNFLFNAMCAKQFIDRDEHFKLKYIVLNTIKNNKKKAVVVVKNKDNLNHYICKVYKLKDKVLTEQLENEKQIYMKLRNISNEYISNYIDYFECDEYIYFITEFVDGITLTKYINENDITSKVDSFIKQCLLGLQFLHEHNIIHGDIKTDNLMINTSLDLIKIIDFDLSFICDDAEYYSTSVFGTTKFIAPESYDIGIYSTKSDVWSLGIVLYIMLTKRYPINELNSIVSGSYNILSRRNMFKHIDYSDINSKCKLYDVVKKMLIFNIDNRCNITELLQILL